MDNNIDIIESVLTPMKIILIHVKNAIVIIIAHVIIIIKKKLYVFFLKINIKNFMKKL